MTDELKEKRSRELIALSAEFAARRDSIAMAWKAEHPNVSRGKVDSPEMKALEQEIQRRYGEILEKYQCKDRTDK